MWADYSAIEQLYPSKVMVVTMRMIPFRLNKKWIESGV
jgi:hypothetical protein